MYIDPLLTNFLLGLLSVLVVWLASHVTNSLAEDRRERKEAEEEARQLFILVESGVVILLRDRLSHKHDMLVMRSKATDSQRRAWVEAYEVYEELITASGQPNRVMEDYLEDILALPTA